MCDSVLQVSLVGEDQESLGLEVESSRGKHSGLGNAPGEQIHHRQALVSVVGARDESCRLVERDHLGGAQDDLFIVDVDRVLGRIDFGSELADHFAVHSHQPGFDEQLSLPTRAVAAVRDVLL